MTATYKVNPVHRNGALGKSQWEIPVPEEIKCFVFPRSHHYENHLHVVRDDHLEVLSFNHDYLVDQDAKVSGISLRKGAPSAGMPTTRRGATRALSA